MGLDEGGGRGLWSVDGKRVGRGGGGVGVGDLLLSRNGNKSESTKSAFVPSNRQAIENSGSWSASPPTYPRNAPKTSHRSRAGPTPFGNSRPTLTRTLKFSWDEQPTIPQDKNSEEWTYKQVTSVFFIKFGNCSN